MLQPNNAKNCPVCRVRFDAENPKDPRPEEKLSSKKSQIKYSRKLTSFYRDLSEKWSEFSEEVSGCLFENRPADQRSEFELNPRLIVEPLSDDSFADPDSAKQLWDLFRRSPDQKVAGVSTLGSTACESYRDHLSAKRMEILSLALKMYNTKRKLGNSRVTSKIAFINLAKES